MWTKEGNETPNSFLLCDIQFLRILVVFCPTLVLLTHAANLFISHCLSSNGYNRVDLNKGYVMCVIVDTNS